jgi:hypothetical protein
MMEGLGAESEEKHEPVSDIDTGVVDSLKALDPERPIACWSRASASSRLHALSSYSSSARKARVRPTRVLAFVSVKRSLRPCVRLFAPLRDKVTSSAQSLVPCGRASRGSSLSIVTEPHDELGTLHSITSSARASRVFELLA